MQILYIYKKEKKKVQNKKKKKSCTTTGFKAQKKLQRGKNKQSIRIIHSMSKNVGSENRPQEAAGLKMNQSL